jgi:hypothetical protein
MDSQQYYEPTGRDMFFRINVVKATGNEQIQVDCPSWNPITGVPLGRTPQQMKEDVRYILDVLDDRASDNQLRMLAAYGLIKYFPLDVQAMIVEVVDVLNGKANPELVVQRWQAIIEENAALEAGRCAAAVVNANGDKLYD